MKKMQTGEASAFDASMPAAQNLAIGHRVREIDSYGAFALVTSIPAGTTGVITPVSLATDQTLFDFEILDITVRTESTVASSTVQVKNGTTAVSDAIASATNKAITRAGSIDPAQNKFYPLSDPAGYAASQCNLVDASGATAAARTVILLVRKL